ncbi:hypothetical protein [Herbidospora sp. NBRC 101105]|uniref:hypothetical protein n=1 Tax=Herbidospora sp. NBRC 101105 TaxID=3032195 RepID=UPI0024A59B6B|nr:hypothetical protein [Herbidospora sp. NBRC 101105]GLX97869.1 hypothetical protein Hesp01_58190 [Herbidospora sp. NBRC 101105]
METAPELSRLKILVGTVAVAVVLAGAAAFYAFDRYTAYLFEREDPGCVADSAVEIERLTRIVVPVLPQRGRSEVDGDSGCAPPEVGPSIAVHVDGASVDELTGRFRSMGWSPVSAARVAEETVEGDSLVAGVEKHADDRLIEVFLTKTAKYPDTVLVNAWFGSGDG